MTENVNPANSYILVVSQDGDISGRYYEILKECHDVRHSDSLPAMHACISGRKPSLVFIDPQICGDYTTDKLSDLLGQLTGIFTVIIDNNSNRRVDQRGLFKAGARGFCRDDITAALLTRAVQQVLDGEYWIPRKLITRMISELASGGAASASRSSYNNSRVESLTPRELQVARMVHLGGNNKMIARELDISERTVKAHLSAIFRKLEIENRLNLALFFNELS